MLDSFQILSQVLPHLAVIAIICGFVGWSLRGRSQQPVQGKSSKPQPSAEKGSDRVKNLEAALEKSRSSHKALKTEMEDLQANTVGKAVLEAANAELDAARKSLESEGKRVAALEVELKKAQETNKHLNARTNSVDKQQKDRSFALENELSNTRQQLARLQERPDDSAELHVEIARLKESVAVSTRFAGEVRKREAAAVEALEKAQAQLAAAADPSRPPATSKKIGPIVDSGRIAAAKAEVLRLVEMNKHKAVASSLPSEEVPQAPPELEAIEAEIPVPVEAEVTIPVLAPPVEVMESEILLPEEVTEISEAAEEPATENEKKSSVPGELFALD